MAKKNRPNEILDDNKRKNLLRTIKERITWIIKDAEILLNNNGQLPIVAALYIHAVEEYGKYLYVKDLPSSCGVVEIEMQNKFLDHTHKIKLASEQLPTECTRLHKGGYGSNFGGNYDTDTMSDWQTRLTILNTDIENGRALHLPRIDYQNIKKAINEFKVVLQNLN